VSGKKKEEVEGETRVLERRVAELVDEKSRVCLEK